MSRGGMHIDTITFGPDGVAITYMEHDGVRVSGKVSLAYQIQLHNSHPDYRDDARRLAELAESVVRNALEDWGNTPSHQGDEIDDEDDDRGMGE